MRAGLAFAAFLSPWLVLHAPHYLEALLRSRSIEAAGGVDASTQLNLFSFERMDYGSSVASYAMQIGAIGASTLMTLWAAGTEDRRWISSARSMAWICAAGITA
jgi:hypothetical protein